MRLRFTLFASVLFFSVAVFAQTPSITTSVSPNKVCPGDSFTISYTVSDTFVYDNLFVVQVSDSTGSFASPMILDTLAGQSDSSKKYLAPALPASANYRFRVVATDPAVVGVASGAVNFRPVIALPNLHFTTGATSLCTGDSSRISLDSLPGSVYTWYFNGHVLTNTHKLYYVARDSGQYIITINDTASAGCESGSYTANIGVFPYPTKPPVTASGPVNICGSGTVTLSTTATNVTYQWQNHGNDIASANSSSYTVSVTGAYRLIVTSAHGCSTKSDSVKVNIHPNPVVSLTLALDSFCLHAAPISLSGGSPAGGYFSGNYVVNNATFYQTSSGLGTFTVYYTYVDSIGCHDTDSGSIRIFDCTTLPSGINDAGNSTAFTMWPNPAQQQVQVTVNTTEKVELRIYNALGQQMGSQTFSNATVLQLNNYAPGVYMVELTGPAQKWHTVRKLVVQ
ncbi:MAG TPA: T9SS type A sorting domain-containing protein [Chitinophagales bacterium]|nr:T9SS type A sorting domain-containing protein [Chitinophagales bacterium]